MRLMSRRFSTTVDVVELEKFKEMSKNWWKSGNFQLLSALNKLRVPFIRDGLIDHSQNKVSTDKPLAGYKLLDVGCGGGILAEPLARLGGEIVGLDASEQLIHVANEHKRDLVNLSYVHSTIEEFAVANKEKFDSIVSSEVIEHIVNKKEFLQHCIACLKPGGSLFFTTMNRTFCSHFVNVFLAEQVLCKVEKGTHDITKFITPHQLQHLLDECGCSTKRIHGFTFNPFTSKWHWIPIVDLSYALHAIKH